MTVQGQYSIILIKIINKRRKNYGIKINGEYLIIGQVILFILK